MTIAGAQTLEEVLFQEEAREYDAVLVMSFGGPEGIDEVRPFLENVTRGRNVPPARLEEVAHHYEQFGGVSPINAQNRALIAALEAELATRGPRLPVYFGNRNWHPLVTDTLRSMKADGVRSAVAFVTSGFSCYSGCRQYREDIFGAQREVGDGAPEIDKLRVFYNHPGFIGPNVARLRSALSTLPGERRSAAHVVFTAHSIPIAMARGSSYERQLREASGLVAENAEAADWALAYQSRSGPPEVPWLEPDILDHIEARASEGIEDLVVVPIGFISDHMEVLFDLDVEARERSKELGVNFVRVPTVGTDPAFVAMIRDLIVERMSERPNRLAMGGHGPSHDICPIDCCQIVRQGNRPLR